MCSCGDQLVYADSPPFSTLVADKVAIEAYSKLFSRDVVPIRIVLTTSNIVIMKQDGIRNKRSSNCASIHPNTVQPQAYIANDEQQNPTTNPTERFDQLPQGADPRSLAREYNVNHILRHVGNCC